MIPHQAVTDPQSPTSPSIAGAESLIGKSRVMCAVRDKIVRAGPFPWPIRIEGPPGSGKNVAARSLSDASGRPGPFVRCSLSVVSAAEGRELAELVGWVRGAFTGATRDQCGYFEQAHRGTLFLNEIHLSSPRVQEVLLHLLEEKSVERLGERVARPIDVRLVFATNTDLKALVRCGRFRADLFDRLGLDVVELPPLRDHVEDLTEIAGYFLTRDARDLGMEPRVFTPAELDRMMSYDWPGNVRELEWAVRYWLCNNALPPDIPHLRRPVSGWRALVPGSLKQFAGNKAAAARALGISRTTLHKYLKAH